MNANDYCSAPPPTIPPPTRPYKAPICRASDRDAQQKGKSNQYWSAS